MSVEDSQMSSANQTNGKKGKDKWKINSRDAYHPIAVDQFFYIC